MSATIPIVTHLGVGDGIIQSGLAIALLARYDKLAFPSYPQHLETFRSIFRAEPRISVYEVPRLSGEDWGSPRDATYNQAIEAAGLDPRQALRLGIYSGRGLAWDFSKSFYQHAQIDYQMRWRACPIADVWSLVPQIEPPGLNGERRIFLHDDRSRGFIIHRSRVSYGTILSPAGDFDQSILRYAAYMIDCEELHCIDSAFFWLADSLPTRGQLFLHRYPRWQRPRNFVYETYRHWNYLD